MSHRDMCSSHFKLFLEGKFKFDNFIIEELHFRDYYQILIFKKCKFQDFFESINKNVFNT